jgi:hypothetical protein
MAGSSGQLAPQQGLLFQVEVLGRELNGQHFEVGSDGLLVGRLPTCDVIFESREVSRRHVYFYPDAGACYVKDLGSKNGMLVNGRRIKQKRLEDGDAVEVGPSRLLVSIRGAPAVDRELPDASRDTDLAARTWAARHSLALACLIFGLLAYLHWSFGLCAGVLSALVFWETRGRANVAGRALATGGLAIGLMGGAVNAWFAAEVPRIQDRAQTAARAACQENLSRIGLTLQAYARRHGGRWPDRLAELAGEGLLEPASLRCPGCRIEEGAACTYFYVGPGSGSSTPGADVAVCDPSLDCHQGQGGWVLRRNGRIEWLPAVQMRRLLERAGQAGGPEAGATGP